MRHGVLRDSWRIGVLLVVVSGTAAQALPRYGPFELSGNLSAQNLIRHRDSDQYAFVQQRNTFKLRFDAQVLDRGRLLDRFDYGLPGIDRMRLFLLYRGVYDSIYDIAPGFDQKDIYGRHLTDLPGALPDRLNDLDGDAVKFENRLSPFDRLAELLRGFGTFPANGPTRLANGTKPFLQGDYHRNPWKPRASTFPKPITPRWRL